jgi:hypothetical protein
MANILSLLMKILSRFHLRIFLLIGLLFMKVNKTEVYKLFKKKRINLPHNSIIVCLLFNNQSKITYGNKLNGESKLLWIFSLSLDL